MQTMGRFIKDTSKFAADFQALTLAFDLTWKDVQTVLSIILALALRTKQRIWAAAQGNSDQLDQTEAPGARKPAPPPATAVLGLSSTHPPVSRRTDSLEKP